MTDELAGNDQATATPMPQAQTQPPTSGKAITSLVLGILSLPWCFCFGPIAALLGIAAVVLAIMARKDVAQGRAGGASSGLAIGGLVCGIIGICLGLISVIILIISLFTNASSSSHAYPYGP